MDKRKQIIHDWIVSLYPDHPFSLDIASSDASFRRYFRLSFNNNIDENSFIVMDAPPEHEEILTFCRVGERFRQVGLNVPEFLHTDSNSGFVIMSDLGSQHYLDNLTTNSAASLYYDALQSLVTLQSGTNTDPEFLPPYSRQLLQQEMNLFRDWYLPVHLGLELNEADNAILDSSWLLLANSALEQPQVWVHRDYHSRNLMLTKQDNPGIIDFQDAVTGPITYDLVSLLKDCYIEWPANRVEEWALNFQEMAVESGLLDQQDNKRFLRWFTRMGVQRHLKVAGIFARLAYRDGKQQYLNDLPLTMNYLLSALVDDEELQPLYRLVSKLVKTKPQL